jgi:hypothetical protein
MRRADERNAGMRRPTFIIIGAGRCGTTTLHAWLGQHPDVLVSRPKETDFFDRAYAKGLDAYWHDHFSHWSGQPAAGEATPAYLRLPYVARRIHRDLPDVRLIASLRNPVERAYSSWWLDHARGFDDRPFEVAVLDELKAPPTLLAGPDAERIHLASRLGRRHGRPDISAYLYTGLYAEHLRVYLDLFPRDRINILLLEDVMADPASTIARIWSFLGVDPEAGRLDAIPRNVARGALTARLYRTPVLRSLAWRVFRGPGARIERALDRLRARPHMSAATRQLLVDHFRDHNRSLERILGRDLSHWDR